MAGNSWDEYYLTVSESVKLSGEEKAKTSQLRRFYTEGDSGLVGNFSGIDALQLGLDVLGLVPVVGEPADGLNAAIYLARGDTLNASLSAASIIPLAGWFSTGGKLTNKSVK